MKPEKFCQVDGKFVDLIMHCNNVITNHENVKIYVGTDSINSKQFTTYCTVVAFRYGTNGAHFIYSKIIIAKIKDRWARLWKEVELSVEVANYLKSFGINIEMIELDLNSDKKWMSNSVVGSGVGYCMGMGYNANIKPEEQISTRAADHILTH